MPWKRRRSKLKPEGWYQMKTDMENVKHHGHDPPIHKKMQAEKSRHTSSSHSTSLSELYFSVKSELLISIKEDLELKLEIESLKQQFLETALVLAQYEGADINDLNIDKDTRERCSLTKHIKSHFVKQSAAMRNGSCIPSRPNSRNSSYRHQGRQSSEHYYGAKHLNTRIQNHRSPGHLNTSRAQLDIPRDCSDINNSHVSMTKDVSRDNYDINAPHLVSRQRINLNNASGETETDSCADLSSDMIRNKTHDVKLVNEVFSSNHVPESYQEGRPSSIRHHGSNLSNENEYNDSSKINGANHSSLSRRNSEPWRNDYMHEKPNYPDLRRLSQMMMPRKGSVQELTPTKTSAGNYKGILVMYDNQNGVPENTVSDNSSELDSSSSDNDEDTEIQLDNISSDSDSESLMLEYDDELEQQQNESILQNNSVLTNQSFQTDSSNTSFSANNEVAQIMGRTSGAQNSSYQHTSADSSGTTTSILDYELHMLNNASSDDEHDSQKETSQQPPLPPRVRQVQPAPVTRQNKNVFENRKPQHKIQRDLVNKIDEPEIKLSLENAELYDLDAQETARENVPNKNGVKTDTNSEHATRVNNPADNGGSSTVETEVECYDLDKEYRSMPSSRTNIHKGVYVNTANKPKKQARRHSSSRQSTSQVSSSDEYNSEATWTINGLDTGSKSAVILRRMSSRYSDASSSFTSGITSTRSSETGSVGEPSTFNQNRNFAKTIMPAEKLNGMIHQSASNRDSHFEPKIVENRSNYKRTSSQSESTMKQDKNVVPETKDIKHPPNGLNRLSHLQRDQEKNSSTSDLSVADNESVYTWTIQDDSDYQNIEDTYEENFTRIHQLEKDFRGSSTQTRVDKLLKQNVCPDHELHMALGEPCTFLMGSDTMLTLLPEEVEELESALARETPPSHDDSSQMTFSDSELFSDDDTELIKLARRKSRHQKMSSTSSSHSSTGYNSPMSSTRMNSSLEALRNSLPDMQAVNTTDSSPGSVTLAVPMNSPTVSDSGNASSASSSLFKYTGKIKYQSTPKKVKKIRFQSPTREEKKMPKKEKVKKENPKKEKQSNKDSKQLKQDSKKISNKKTIPENNANDNGGIWMGDDNQFGGVYMGDDPKPDDKYGGVYLGGDDNKESKPPLVNNNYKGAIIEDNRNVMRDTDIYGQDDELAVFQRDKKKALKQKLRQFTNVFSKNEHESDIDLRTMGLL